MLESLVSELVDVEVLSFGHSAEALARAPTLDANLFIVDYRMPAPNGMELLSALREDPRTNLTPVVMVTAAEEREVCYAALERGASDFLVRPIDPREFTRRIGNQLALEAARHEAAAHLRREEAAARINARRLNLIWRAGASAADDETFLNRLIEHASHAVIEDRHCAAMLMRHDGDELVVEVANEIAEASGEGVGFRVPLSVHQAAIEADAVEAIADLPTERRGQSNWRAALFANSMSAGRGIPSASSRVNRKPRASTPSIAPSSKPSRGYARTGSISASSSNACAIKPSTTR